MPLNFSNWSWTQSESTVYIQLPLRGAAAGKVDIVSTERYLKVNTAAGRSWVDGWDCSWIVGVKICVTATSPCDGQQTCGPCVQVHHPPYLFEAFLVQPVDEAASTARVTDAGVVISLAKKTCGLWKDLLSAAGLHTAAGF